VSKVCKLFQKIEWYFKAAYVRLINSRVDSWKVCAGPWIKAIEEVVYKHKAFKKHLTKQQLLDRVRDLRKDGCFYLATDFTAYEAGFTPVVMRSLECVLFRYMLQNFPEVAEEICAVDTGSQECRGRLIKLMCEGTRMSGDMWTSLANGFSNLVMFDFLCREQHISWDGIVEGDDGLFAVDKLPVDPEGFYAKLGHRLKLEIHDDPSHASFCGVVVADQGILRNPYEVLLGFGWTSSFVHAGQKIQNELLRARSLSLAYETGSCPVLWALARRGLVLTRGYAARFIDDGYHNVPRDESVCLAEVAEPSPATRALFHRLYGMSVAQQLAVEHYISTHIDLDPYKMGIQDCIPGVMFDNSRNVVYG